jgi:hypothetical protein
MLMILMNAYEHQDITTVEISRAYLHATMKDFVCLHFTGWATDLLCEVKVAYGKDLTFEGKTKVLYMRSTKAIYRCVNEWDFVVQVTHQNTCQTRFQTESI